MKGWKKCTFYGRSFGLSLIAFFTVFSSSAFAAPVSNYGIAANNTSPYVKAFTVCGSTADAKIQAILNATANKNWRQKLNSLNSKINFASGDSWIIHFTDTTTDRMRIAYVKSGASIQGYEAQDAFNPFTNRGRLRVTSIEPSTTLQPATDAFLVDLTAGSAPNLVTLYGQSADMDGAPDSCLYEAYGWTWDASYTATKPTMKDLSTITEETIPDPSCSPLNLLCWLGKITSQMASTYRELAEAILTGFAALFTPDTTTFEYQFDELTTFFGDKLGFLFYPIEWLLDMLGGVVGTIDNDISWGVSQCSISSLDLGLTDSSSIQFMGMNIPFNTMACNAFTSYFATATRVIFPPLIGMYLIFAFRHKIHEIKTKA